MPAKKKFDAIVIGGGHNGLVNGAYLAKAGLSTLILERRHLVGGAAITEELHPGFSFTTFSYALSLLRPEIIHELELTKHGFMPLLMPSTFAPTEDGDYILLGQDKNENHHEISRHSPHDADAYDAYGHMMEQVVHAIRPLMDSIPPDITSKDPEERARMAAIGSYLADLPPGVLHDMIRLMTGSAADILEDYFESDLMQGLHASSGIIGTKVGPRSQGSGLVLLYHSFGEHDGAYGAWAFHKGGNGGFTQVLARAAESFGAEIRLESPVDHVVTKNGRATGVVLEDGTELEAKTVVSAVDPRRTFMQLVDPRELPTDLVENIRRFKFQGTSAKVNFALDANPTYPGLEGRSDQYRGFINMGPSLDYLERAFDDAKYGWYSQKPYIDGCIQSNVDPDMAPPGKAVMSCFIQYAPYHLKESDWDSGAGPVRRCGAEDPGGFFPRVRRPGASPGGGHPPRHREGGRSHRGQHLRRRVPRSPDVLLPPRTRVEPISHPDRGLLPMRLRDPSRRLRHGRPRPLRLPTDPRGPGQEEIAEGPISR